MLTLRIPLYVAATGEQVHSQKVLDILGLIGRPVAWRIGGSIESRVLVAAVKDTRLPDLARLARHFCLDGIRWEDTVAKARGTVRPEAALHA